MGPLLVCVVVSLGLDAPVRHTITEACIYASHHLVSLHVPYRFLTVQGRSAGVRYGAVPRGALGVCWESSLAAVRSIVDDFAGAAAYSD